MKNAYLQKVYADVLARDPGADRVFKACWK